MKALIAASAVLASMAFVGQASALNTFGEASSKQRTITCSDFAAEQPAQQQHVVRDLARHASHKAFMDFSVKYPAITPKQVAGACAGHPDTLVWSIIKADTPHNM